MWNFHCSLHIVLSVSSNRPGIVLVRCQITEYHYINELKSWKDAQQHCRDYYTDLATIQSIEDARKVPMPTNTLDWAWIGLFDDPVSWRGTMTADSNSWKWWSDGNPSTYTNWLSGQPDGVGDCFFLSSNYFWDDDNCDTHKKFVCQNGKI
uniref:C-type lectin domain-containing protein n=1 Tax=Neogobius melanostomus TaxID=47308 RepID=A0A8C6V1T5_9GOBI